MRNPGFALVTREDFSFLTAADAQGLFIVGLVARAVAQCLTDPDALVYRVALFVLTPPHHLCAQEIPVTVVNHDGRGTVLELQERGVVAWDGTLRQPLAGLRAHAAQHASAEQPYGIYLVRSLAKGNAPALSDVQLVGGARTQHPVRIGPNIQRAQRAELARLN